MKYSNVEDLNNGTFRRLTGVKRTSYENRLDALIDPEIERKKLEEVEKNKLCMEERLLTALGYSRERRTLVKARSMKRLSGLKRRSQNIPNLPCLFEKSGLKAIGIRECPFE